MTDREAIQMIKHYACRGKERTMSDYISREELMNYIKYDYNQETFVFKYPYGPGNIPSADVAPVVHGRWECEQLDNFRKFEVRCSVCDWVGIENYDSCVDPSVFDFCPNCGAKMDAEEE